MFRPSGAGGWGERQTRGWLHLAGARRRRPGLFDSAPLGPALAARARDLAPNQLKNLTHL